MRSLLCVCVCVGLVVWSQHFWLRREAWDCERAIAKQTLFQRRSDQKKRNENSLNEMCCLAVLAAMVWALRYARSMYWHSTCLFVVSVLFTHLREQKKNTHEFCCCCCKSIACNLMFISHGIPGRHIYKRRRELYAYATNGNEITHLNYSKRKQETDARRHLRMIWEKEGRGVRERNMVTKASTSQDPSKWAICRFPFTKSLLVNPFRNGSLFVCGFELVLYDVIRWHWACGHFAVCVCVVWAVHYDYVYHTFVISHIPSKCQENNQTLDIQDEHTHSLSLPLWGALCWFYPLINDWLRRI